MSYAMCLDNSWDVMCEEEMYDVNGGFGISNQVIAIGFDIGFAALCGGLSLSGAYKTMGKDKVKDLIEKAVNSVLKSRAKKFLAGAAFGTTMCIIGMLTDPWLYLVEKVFDTNNNGKVDFTWGGLK